MCMYILSVCMYVYQMYAVPKGARRQCQTDTGVTDVSCGSKN